MSKKQGLKTNFRVVIEPRGLGDFGSVSMSVGLLYGRTEEAQKRIAREEEERANEVMADVKRHVDNVGRAYVEFDQEHVCEHCGSAWTEKSPDYNGGCCDKDEQANEERTKAKTDELMDSLGFPGIRPNGSAA
jgi:hypothetical protein